MHEIRSGSRWSLIATYIDKHEHIVFRPDFHTPTTNAKWTHVPRPVNEGPKLLHPAAQAAA